MALPAILPPDASIEILRQREFADGDGVRVFFRETLAAGEATHVEDCGFRHSGRPLHSDELIALAVDGRALNDASLYFLDRFWLATPEARAADPAPLGDLAGLPRLSPSLAYALQQALDGLPLAAIYALLAASYSLVYGLVGRINLAFGDLAAAGGYATALGALLAAGETPAAVLATALTPWRGERGAVGSGDQPLGLAPLSGASGQQMLVASVGLAISLGELLRLAQGNRQIWVSPMFNAPFGVARAPGFIVATAPDALLAVGCAAPGLAAERWSPRCVRDLKFSGAGAPMPTIRWPRNCSASVRARFWRRPSRWPARWPVSRAS